MGKSETLERLSVRAPVKHSMLRRCWVHDYRRPATYMITLTLADRSRPVLGRLVEKEEDLTASGEARYSGEARCGGDARYGGETRYGASPLAAKVPRIALSPLGEAVALAWRDLVDFMPGVEPLDFQVMPDHFHGILRVTRQLPKPIGAAIGAFKVKHPGLWSPGYQDSIAFDDARLARMIAYIKDNPRRLALKRAHRDLFKVVSRLPFGAGAFMALGNRFLLDAPEFYQIQCSRSVTAGELEQKKADCLEAIKRGAVIVSPCISVGEREMAQLVFEAKGKLVVLKNKGFAPLYKPSGEMFDACAEGRILMLAPIAWPYVPGKKPLTRFDACVMNRLAQLICKEDAATINYKGMTPLAIDELVTRAMQDGVG